MATHLRVAQSEAHEERPSLRGQPVFRIQREGNKIKLRGPAPTAEDQKTVLGMVDASFPGYGLHDRTRVDARYNGGDGWLNAVSFALRKLAFLHNGGAHIYGNQVSLYGVAETAESYKTLQTALQSEPPEGLVLRDVSIRPPEADFIWLAQMQEGSVILHGHVGSHEAKAAISDLAQQLFPEAYVRDETQVTPNGPKDCLSAALISLQMLRQLQSGSVSVSDQLVQLDGVHGAKEAQEEIAMLRKNLPSGFVLEDDAEGGEQTVSSQPVLR